MKRLEEDQFLELMTIKTEVHAVFKEPYRSGNESLKAILLPVMLKKVLTIFELGNLLCYLGGNEGCCSGY